MYILLDWVLLSDKRIAGKVYGNPKFIDGERVITFPVVEQDGNVVTTTSGNKYYLAIPKIL